MASKQFVLEENLTLLVTKRSSSKHIKLTLGRDGQVKASIPNWLPYKAAYEFALTKLPWIKQKLPKTSLFIPGQQIGKNHRLLFKPTSSETITTRLGDLQATVFYPGSLDIQSPGVQTAAKRLVKRALSAQAQHLLPQRLNQLALKYGYSYSGVKIKNLKSRWGSCDQQRQISLSLQLMNLPWELIDYVLVHELNHTLVMQHGPKFWQTFEQKMPNCLELRKQLRSYSAV